MERTKEFKIVIGANFGDEGKGLATDFFAAEAARQGRKCLVVCSNGGAQRGHTVTLPDGRRHVFHHFGSGTFAGADTRLPYFFVINPMIFMQEYEELLGMMGADDQFPVRVYLHPDSPVTTPFDMITNQIVEAGRGDNRHGSCGLGIWETILRQGASEFAGGSGTLGKMAAMSDGELRVYLEMRCRMYLGKRLRELGVGRIPEGWLDILDNPHLIENYIMDFREMLMHVIVTEDDRFAEYDTVIFENGQGLLLDRCRKEYGNHTTPSNTGLRNPAALIREYISGIRNAGIRNDVPAWKQSREENAGKEKDEMNIEVCYVTRTYLTRHGAGPMDGECQMAAINPDMIDRTNMPNPYQGTLRYGKLDEKIFWKRIREDFERERFPAGCKVRMTVMLTHLNEYDHPLAERSDYLSAGETGASVCEAKRNETQSCLHNVIGRVSA